MLVLFLASSLSEDLADVLLFLESTTEVEDVVEKVGFLWFALRTSLDFGIYANQRLALIAWNTYYW